MVGDGRREMTGTDGRLMEIVEPGSIAAWFDARLPHAELACAAAGALFVLAGGAAVARFKARRRGRR
jgi:hypothetical protein